MFGQSVLQALVKGPAGFQKPPVLFHESGFALFRRRTDMLQKRLTGEQLLPKRGKRERSSLEQLFNLPTQ